MQELQWQYVKSVQGNCGKCNKPIQNGGWVKFSNTGISAILCDDCKNTKEEVEEVTKTKKAKITVREVNPLFGIFGVHYEVLSTTNLMAEKIIDAETLMHLMDDDNTQVTIKY